MKDYNKYIGIPFKEHGRDIRGADCFGLLKMLYLEFYNVVLPDWKVQSYHVTDINYEVKKGLSAKFDRIDEPEIGDVGIFVFAGLPTHIGMYIGSGKIIHVLENETAVIESVTTGRLKGRLYGWYRYKK